jgi:tetratricopeptide (TPR) repeat protein
MTLPMNIESFTIIIGDVLAASANIQVMWENTVVSIPVEADIDGKIMKSIDGAMNVDSRPYFAAAGYYYDNGKDLSKALEWVNKAVEAQPSAYWMVHLKAKIQAKMGDKVAAKATATKGIELAKAGGNPDYVALNEKLIATLK